MKPRREKDDRRFFGNGNWADAERRHRGWQVVCAQCSRQSKPVVTSHHKPVPPDEIAHRFARQGWLIGKHADEDVCQQCLEEKRTEAAKKNELHERNMQRVKHVREAMTKLDHFLTGNVVMYSTPEFLGEQADLIQAFGSLLDTAFLCNLMPSKWKEQPVPYSRVTHLQTIWDAATHDERVAFLSAAPHDDCKAEAANDWAARWVTAFKDRLDEFGRSALINALVNSLPADGERAAFIERWLPTPAISAESVLPVEPSSASDCDMIPQRFLDRLAAAYKHCLDGTAADGEKLALGFVGCDFEPVRRTTTPPPPSPASAPSPEPAAVAPTSNISPRMAELRDRARRQLNGVNR